MDVYRARWILEDCEQTRRLMELYEAQQRDLADVLTPEALARLKAAEDDLVLRFVLGRGYDTEEDDDGHD